MQMGAKASCFLALAYLKEALIGFVFLRHLRRGKTKLTVTGAMERGLEYEIEGIILITGAIE